MDAFETNKLIGGFLMAVLVALVIGQVAGLVVSPHRLDKPVFVVAGAPAATAAAATAGPADVEPVAALLAKADADAGKAVFRQCSTCHNADKGGRASIGPNLWDIVGARKGHSAGFAYSPAILAEAQKPGDDSAWTYEQLNHFLANPRGFIPGTKMTFSGLRKAEDRANLIAFLRSQSDAPKPLP
jgi:cytochrome c